MTNDGSRLWVAFYDRHYGNCETTGCNDITAAQIRNPTSNNPSFSYTRVTTSSMPNLTPANNPVQAGFLGDYMWVDTDIMVTRTSSGRTRARSGATLPRRTSTTPRFTEAAEVTRHA